jgi:hypothetical protein
MWRSGAAAHHAVAHAAVEQVGPAADGTGADKNATNRSARAFWIASPRMWARPRTLRS